jgi:hypothetical protein
MMGAERMQFRRRRLSKSSATTEDFVVGFQKIMGRTRGEDGNPFVFFAVCLVCLLLDLKSCKSRSRSLNKRGLSK